MGGGDLNSKKSWHPNTMKNQERVWKAEQAAAEEKKRILELQHEHAAERDRSELNDLAKRSAGAGNNDDRLHWMYDKPDKKGPSEDYLLGKTIEKNYDQPDKSDIIPAVARRVVGSSMMTSAEDSQVDLARKMREDPLLLVKERERAARAALLNNPLHRKRITEILRKEQEQHKGSKVKKSKKKDLDSMLAAKLNALGGEKGLDVAALLASDNSCSSSESSDDENKKKKKKNDKKTKQFKKSKKMKKHKDREAESSEDSSLHQESKEKERKAYVNKKNKDFKTRMNLDDVNRQDSSNRDKFYIQSTRKRSDSSTSESIGGSREVSEERRYKVDYKKNRIRRSQDSEKVYSSKKNKQSFDSEKHYYQKATRKQRSKSHESEREVPYKRSKIDASVDKRDSWKQNRKRSVSVESNKKIKRNKEETSAERRQEERECRKQINEHCIIRNNTSRADVSKDKTYKVRRNDSGDKMHKDEYTEKRGHKIVSQHSGKATKYNTSKRESSEDEKFKGDDKLYNRKKRSLSRDSGKEIKHRKSRIESPEDNRSRSDPSSRKRRDSSSDRKKTSQTKLLDKSRGRVEEKQKIKVGLSEEEKAARLAEMVVAGAEREHDRARRVAAQRAAAAAPAPPAAAPAPPAAARAHHPARDLPDSLQARIHSNRHYIQRNQTHMNEHFARR